MNYTTIARVEAYALTDVAAGFEANVTQWIGAVSRLMDTLTNRKLVADGTATAKFYDGNGRMFTSIDDTQSVTLVRLGDQYGANFATIAAGDYMKYPVAAPHRAVVLKSGIFTGGLQNVEVTGDWGYLAALPEDLAFAATVIVAGIINSHNPNAQRKTMEKIGNYQVAYADDKGLADFKQALTILDGYKKHLI